MVDVVNDNWKTLDILLNPFIHIYLFYVLLVFMTLVDSVLTPPRSFSLFVFKRTNTFTIIFQNERSLTVGLRFTLVQDKFGLK